MSEIIAYRKFETIYINVGDTCQMYNVRKKESKNISMCVFADIKKDFELGDELIKPLNREEVEKLFDK